MSHSLYNEYFIFHFSHKPGTSIDKDPGECSGLSSVDDSYQRELRSSEGKRARPWIRRHMFPDECLLCNGAKYRRDRVSGKRSLVRLIKCKQVKGGQLLTAARKKEDTILLQKIDGQDLVARELQYHPECYKAYTRFLGKKSRPLTPIQAGYEDAFSEFADDVIRRRLIQNKEILTLARLNKLFVSKIREIHGIDAPYRTWNLKKRLQQTFPQLIFIRPSNRRMSDIVFTETLSAEDLVEDLLEESTSGDSSIEDDKSANISMDEDAPPTQSPNATSNLRTL